MRNKHLEWFTFISQIKWTATLAIILLHLGAFYGAFLAIHTAKWQTVLFGYFLAVSSGIGTLMGAHRYYSHRSFKATLPLRIILLILQTLTGQKSIINWAREHRTHHQFTGTDADCTNINRGFFFAHMGWLLTQIHPDCQRRMDECNVDDLWADPLVKFQYHYYGYLFTLINIIIPTVLPAYLFDETFVNCFFGAFMFRYVYTLHVSFCGNSVAHVWGSKPYDKTMTATHNESLIYATLGGAYHNYHHVFPFDYSASELGCISNFNFMTALIDFFATIGWAYDRRRAPVNVIYKRKLRTGDQTIDTNYNHKHPIVDWFLGLTLSASVLWILFVFKLINYNYNLI